MMSTVVRMEGYGAADTLCVVQEIREWGLIQGQDFDFAYHPPVYHDRQPVQVEVSIKRTSNLSNCAKCRSIYTTVMLLCL